MCRSCLNNATLMIPSLPTFLSLSAFLLPHIHTLSWSKNHFLEDEQPPKSLPSDDVPKPPPDANTTTSHAAPPVSTVRETTPTPASAMGTPVRGKGGGARNEPVGGEPQTPSGPGQLSGMFSRLKKRVTDTAWYGTETKVCDSWNGNQKVYRCLLRKVKC